MNEVVITAKESSVLKSVMFNSKITGSSYPLSIDGNAVCGDGNDDSVNVQSLTVLGTSEINGGSINTSGNQSYGKAVSLGSDTEIIGAVVTFTETISCPSGAKNLELTTSETTFNDAVSVKNFVVFGGTVNVNADITTTEDVVLCGKCYNDTNI